MRLGRFESKSTILFCLPWDLHYLGGVNQVVSGLLRETAKRPELEPRLLVIDAATHVARDSDSNGYPTTHINLVSMWDAQRPWRNLLTLLYRFPANFLRLCSLLRRLRPSAINLHYAQLYALTLLLALRLALPHSRFVLSFHGADLRDALNTGFAGMLWRRLLNAVDAITCCSENLSATLRARYPNCRTPIATIHNGIDVHVLEAGAARNHQPVAPGRFIVNVATFEHKKGQDVLLHAWSRIQHHYPDLKLVLIGRDGPLLAEVRTLIEQLKLSERVIVIPGLEHEATLAAIRDAQAFVLSSRDEPFGIVLLEAAFFNVPIVATRVGGVPEILKDRESAILVEPDSSDELADGIAAVLGDVEASRARARVARAVAIERFTWDATFAHYKALLLGDASNARAAHETRKS